MKNKQAIILNYGMMVNELHLDIQEKTQFISRFFRSEPDLNHDPDLMDIAQEFQNFCIALKRLDSVIGRKHEEFLP